MSLVIFLEALATRALPSSISRKVADKLIGFADRARARGDWASAVRHYRTALLADAARSGIWVQYGHALKEAGDRAAAEAAYKRAKSCGLDDADIHLQLGHVLKLQGRFSEASAAYAEAFRRDPGQPDIMLELTNLGWTRADFRQVLGAGWPARQRARKADGSPIAIFDVSDLVHYMATSRRPTGIQRVQLNVIGALLTGREAAEPMLVCYAPAASYWVEIPVEDFRELATLMGEPGSIDNPAWQRLRRRMMVHLGCGEDASLPRGSTLINLGSSWAFGNYALAVRRAKAERSIIYVPFIHDCIPILFPDWFVPELQRDFREWLSATLTLADGFLTNSKSTAADFAAIARELGHRDVRVTPVLLDGTFSTDRSELPGLDQRRALLDRLGLAERKFVLFVSTIEPRKNHEMLFEAWQAMIRTRAWSDVPPLVCVGGRGWRNSSVLDRLDSDARLRAKVLLVHDLTDEELDMLYGGCRFTVYPSRYEGWGLPITEALSRGRLVLAALASSLPEAGGDLAEYFSLTDPSELAAKLASLIDDDRLLAEREARIATMFAPRSWAQIAEEILQRALSVPESRASRLAARRIPHAAFLRLGKGKAGARPSGVALGEWVRSGAGWGEPDERGSWLAGCENAEIVFIPPGEAAGAELRVRMLIHATTSFASGRSGDTPPPDDGRRHILSVRAGEREIAKFRIEADQERWVAFDVKPCSGDTPVRLVLEAQSEGGLSRRTRAVGIMGLFVSRREDEVARLAFIEGVVLGAIHEPIGGLVDADKAELVRARVVSTRSPGLELPLPAESEQ